MKDSPTHNDVSDHKSQREGLLLHQTRLWENWYCWLWEHHWNTTTVVTTTLQNTDTKAKKTPELSGIDEIEESEVTQELKLRGVWGEMRLDFRFEEIWEPQTVRV